MPQFSYDLPERYPEVSFRVEISTSKVEGLPFAAQAYLNARGPENERGRWRNDVKDWAEKYAIRLHNRHGKNRDPGSSEFDLCLASWDEVTAFMVRWVGVDLFIGAASDTRDIIRSIGRTDAEVRALVRQVEKLTHAIVAYEQQMRRNEQRLQAVGRALSGDVSSQS